MEFFNQTLQDLESKLQPLDLPASNTFLMLDHNIKTCKDTLSLLRLRVEAKGFESIDQECAFFKTIKPQIVGYLIHFINLLQIHRHHPFTSFKHQSKVYHSHILLLQSYFAENREFYEYYIRGLTESDIIFFTRGRNPICLHFDSLPAMMDKNFSTSHDMLLAKILGNHRTIEHLVQIINPKEYLNPQFPNERKKETLKWTGTKADLVELIYALHSSGTVNNGKADLKELGTTLETMFQIELGDIYRTFLEIRSRKTQPTKLLNLLKTSLINKMLAFDE